jgi:hypothetical protein
MQIQLTGSLLFLADRNGGDDFRVFLILWTDQIMYSHEFDPYEM